MDNTKIFIDVDDEITFIAERVLGAKTQNVILIAPEKASLLSSLASMKLLNHVVGKSGKRVVLVTMDETGKMLAAKAGFKTRNRVGEVEPAIWEEFIENQVQKTDVENPLLSEGLAATEDVEEQSFADKLLMSQPKLNQDEAEVSILENEAGTEPEAELSGEEIGTLEAKVEDSYEEAPKIKGNDEGVEPIDEVITEVAREIAEEENIQNPIMEASVEEVDSSKSLQTEKEFTLEELKAKNPSVFEIESLPIEEVNANEAPQVSPSKPQYVESVRIVKLDGFDLVVGGDAAVIKKSRELERKVVAKKADTIETLHQAAEEGHGSIIGHDVEVNSSKKKVTRLPLFLNPIMEKLQELRKKHGKKIRPWMIVPAAIALIALFVVWYILLSRAVVAVGVQSNNLSENAAITANINNSTIDINNNAIPAYIRDINESSSSSLNTTGTKQVGQNATGPITIYNNTSNSITIRKGTVFVTNDNSAYQFTLNNDVTIPAANGAPQSAPGSLTAQTFGSQYNIPKNTAFNIQDTSIPTQGVTASSSDTFTGGTSSTAQVVAQSDQDNLLKSLEDQLYQKGESEISTKLNANEIEVKDSLKNEDVSKAFDSNVGDKASILNLSLTTKTSVLVYSNDDINKFATKFLSKDLKGDEVLSNLQVTPTLKSYDSSTGNITLSLDMKAVERPELNTKSISEIIKGKTTGSAISYISSQNGVKDVSIKVSPFWVGWIHMMPPLAHNISYQINNL